MINTYGLTHLALAVESADRAFRFYRDVFGMVAVYNEDGMIQAQTPGAHDAIVFDESLDRCGEPGGIVHFGFRLTNPADIDEAVAAVERAGGTVREKGEFCPGEPYLFATDPDGYEIEIWYEP